MKSKEIIPILIFLFSFPFLVTLFAQGNKEIDSLITQINTLSDDTNKVKSLLVVSKLSFRDNNYSVLNFAQKAENLAVRLSDTIGIMNSLLMQTQAYTQKGHIDSAQIKIINAIEIGNANTCCQKLLAKSYFYAGNVYSDLNDYQKAADHYLKALEYYEETGNKKAQAILVSSLSKIYILLDENEKAIEYIENEKEFLEPESKSYAAINSNLAIAYKNTGNYKKALECYNEVLLIETKMQDSFNIAMTYNGIGVLHIKMKNYDTALKNLHNALEIKEKLGNPKYIASTLNNIATIKIINRDYLGAIELSKRSYNLANSVDAIKEVFYALENLFNAYEQLGQFNDALLYYKLYYQAKDSIAFQKEGGKDVIHEYEIKAKEDELKLQKALSKNKTYLIIMLGLIILITGISIYFYIKTQKNKHQQKITAERVNEAETQKKRFAKDLHDDTGSNLTGIRLQLLALKKSTKDSSKIDEVIAEVERTHQGIRLLAYQASPPEFDNYTLDEAISDLVRRLKKTGSVKIQYSCIVTLDWSQLKQEFQLNIYRVIQEAISNIFKHANARNVDIQIIQHETNLNIMIEDDGKGFNTEAVNKGLGLANIQERTKTLEGVLQIDSSVGKGCTIIIELPLPKNIQNAR